MPFGCDSIGEDIDGSLVLCEREWMHEGDHERRLFPSTAGPLHVLRWHDPGQGAGTSAEAVGSVD